MRNIDFHRLLVIVVVSFGIIWTNQSQADAPTGQYVISNGTVFDTKSQLTWEQNPSMPLVSFDAANAYCQGLSLAGGNWRLPSIKEIQTIVDETRVDPAIDPAVFPNTPLAKFWSSTRMAGDPASAWEIHADYGATGVDDVAALHNVRCVR